MAKYYPGAFSNEAATLLAEIATAGVWYPCWREMSKAQIDAFGELQRALCVESCAYYGYRVKGYNAFDAMKERVSQRNQELFVLYGGTGVDPLVAKWEARAGIKDFRMRPWLERVRVREAHLQHWQDVQETLGELRRAG